MRKDTMKKERLSYQRQISRSYNKQIRPQYSQIGCLSIKSNRKCAKRFECFEFRSKMRRSFIVREPNDNDYYLISRANSKGYLARINGT